MKKKTQKAITFIDKKENLTARCPAACLSTEDATRLVRCMTGVDAAIRSALDSIRTRLFDPLTVIFPDGSKQKTTVFNLYNTGLPGEYNWVPSIRCGRKTYTMVQTSTVNKYLTRSLYRKESPILGTMEQVTSDILGHMPGVADTKVAHFVYESVFMPVNTMVSNYARRVSRLSKPTNGRDPDKKWTRALIDAIDNSSLPEESANILLRVLDKCGPQTERAAAGELPDLSSAFGKKLNSPLTYYTRKSRTKESITPEMFYGIPTRTRKSVYMASYRNFIRLVTGNFPEPQGIRPLNVSGITHARINGDGYFDREISFRLPGGPLRLQVRTRSGKGTGYYPEDLFALTTKNPSATIVLHRNDGPESLTFPGAVRGTPAITANIPYTVERSIPVLKKEDVPEVDLGRTVGVDAGEAVAMLVTTIPNKEIGPDMVDWHEAVHAYYGERPDTNLFARTKSRTTREDLKRLVSEYESGSYSHIAVFTLALRDGPSPDSRHGWKPTCDPCAPFLAWLSRRTNPDGTPFYGKRQLAIIGHTKAFRRAIRAQIANKLHYFHEQALWDRSHDPETEVFAKMSKVADTLIREFNALDRTVSAERTFLFSLELGNQKTLSGYDIVSMEGLNFSGSKKERMFTTLRHTVSDDWGMDPKAGFRIVASDANSAKVDFGRKVTPREVRKLCKDTAHWQEPFDISVKGTVATLKANPTREGELAREAETVANLCRKALGISSVKGDAERILSRKGVLYREVPAKFTSQTCHACGHAKAPDKDEKASRELCAERNLNFRFGRSFVCGNPECKLHGVEQNADANAALNIRNLVKYMPNKSSKTMEDK